LDTSHCVFFEGSHLAESTHICLLLFHLSLLIRKCLKELLIGVSGFRRDYKDLCGEAKEDWESST